MTLDAPTDLISYSMGDVDLVRMDLQQTLPPPVYEEAMRVLRVQGLHAAYDCRRELVNFKKVLPAVIRSHTHTGAKGRSELRRARLRLFPNEARCFGDMQLPTCLECVSK